MATISVEKFLDVVRVSNLVAPDALSRAVEGIRQSGSAEQLASAEYFAAQLHEAGLLTRWQCDKLLQGKSKGFFLGKYKLLGHLGTGGMSAVYLAEHVTMKRRVAIKVLPTHRVDDSSYLARFKLEAQAAAALDNVNIVRAFDIDNDDKTHYIVMEYVEGRDLQHIVKDSGPLSFEAVADYMMQAASGLEHAHEAGFVHRDIKPANLLVDQRGVVKVLDMGLAKFTDDSLSSLTIAHDENVLGTADYLAPEQAINSHSVDNRADLYSLGCTMYFLLTGNPPFPDGTLPQRLMMHQTKMPSSIYNFRPNAPAPLVDLCMKMMAKRADERPQTAGEVVSALSAWLAASGDASAAATGRAKQAEASGLRLAAAGLPRRRDGGDAGGGNSGLGSAAPRRQSGPPRDRPPGVGDTVADANQNTMKGPGRSKPAGAGDSVKGPGAAGGLRMAKSLDADPFAFLGQENPARQLADGPPSAVNRAAGKDAEKRSQAAPDRAKDAGRSSAGRRTGAEARSKRDGAAKRSGAHETVSRDAKRSVDAGSRARRRPGDMSQWLWAFVGVGLVACLVMIGITIHMLMSEEARTTAPSEKDANPKPAASASDKNPSTAEPKSEAKTVPKSESTPESAVKSESAPAAEAKSQPAVEPKPEPAAETKPAPAAEAAPGAAVEPKPEPPAEQKPKGKNPNKGKNKARKTPAKARHMHEAKPSPNL